MAKQLITEIEYCNHCPHRSSYQCIKENKTLPLPEDGYVFIPKWCPLPDVK